jgi:hypothetical protein
MEPLWSLVVATGGKRWQMPRAGTRRKQAKTIAVDVVVERCAGLDVQGDSVVAAVRVPGKGKSRRRREQQTCSFRTTIDQLEQVGDWLAGFGVTLVGMEATGVYWRAVFLGARAALRVLALERLASPSANSAQTGSRAAQRQAAFEASTGGQRPLPT